MRFNKISLAVMLMSGSMLLVACGGGDSAPAPGALVATTNTSAVIDQTTGAAVVQGVLDKNFGFANGVPSFGTTSATSLSLSGSGAAPSFNISSTEGTATGAMAYGSCIFKIATSNFPLLSPLALGKEVTVSPCTLSIGTAGVSANGGSSTSTVTLQLGTINSMPVSVPVSISSTGAVTVNGSAVGSVILVPATGAIGVGG